MPEQSSIIQLADAVVADFADATFAVTVTAQRVYIPRTKPEELPTEGGLVLVVPKDDAGERESRAKWVRQLKLDVGVFARLDTSAETSIDDQLDALLLLTEQLGDFYANEAKTPGNYDAPLMAVAPSPLWDPEYVDKRHIFAAVLEFTFRGWR